MDLDTIRRITIITQQQGAEAAAAELQKLADAEQKLTVASDQLTQKSASVEKSFTSLQARIDPTFRAQQNAEKDTRALANAMAQGLVPSATRAADVLGLINQRYKDTIDRAHSAAEGHSLFGRAMDGVRESATEYAGELGLVGRLMADIGPAGIALGGTIGVAAIAYEKAKESANEFGQEMLRLRNVSQVTGLTTTEFQALQEKAAEFGVSGEQAGRGLERFSAQMDQFKQRAGPLYELMTRIDDGLAQQMVHAGSTREQIDLLSKAYEGATKEQQAALSKATFGRAAGGLFDLGSAIKALGESGGIEAAVHHAGDAIDNDLIKRVAELKTQADDAGRRASEVFNSIFSEALLSRQKTFNNQLLEAARVLKDFSINPSAGKVIDLLSSGARSGYNFLSSPFPVPPIPSNEELNNNNPAPTAQQFVSGLAISQGNANKNIVSGADIANIMSAKDGVQQLNQQIQTGTGLTTNWRAAVLGFGEAVVSAGHEMELTWEKQIRDGDEVARRYDQLSQKIKTTAHDLEDLKAAQGAGGTSESLQPAINSAQVMLQTEKDTKAETDRRNESLLSLQQSYSGLLGDGQQMTLETVKTVAAQHEQLSVAQAVGVAQRLASQETATRNTLMQQGKSFDEASLVASNQRQISQAEINAGGQQLLNRMRDQYGVANATTAQEKIQAQYIATRNQLIAGGLPIEQASAIAGQEKMNAEAAYNNVLNHAIALASAVTGEEKLQAMYADERKVAQAEINSETSRHVIDLQRSTELIQAQTADIGTGSSVEEARVKIAQAYQKAIEDGADAQHALAAATATAANEQARLDQQAEQTRQTLVKQAQAEEDAAQAAAKQSAAATSPKGIPIGPGPKYVYAGQYGVSIDTANIPGTPQYQANQKQVQDAFQIQSQLYMAEEAKKTEAAKAENVFAQGVLGGKDAKALFQQLLSQGFSSPDYTTDYSGKTKIYSDLNSQLNMAKEAGYSPQEELDLLQSGQLGKGASFSDILDAMNTLKDSINQNTTATNNNSATIDPIYSQGHAALQIGYYGQGSVAGNITATDWGNSAVNPLSGPTTTALGNPIGIFNPNNPTPTPVTTPGSSSSGTSGGGPDGRGVGNGSPTFGVGVNGSSGSNFVGGAIVLGGDYMSGHPSSTPKTDPNHPGMIWVGAGISGGRWVNANDFYANPGMYETLAGGGIMTKWGRVPLKKYDGGGIARSPQLAMFGEGSSPEAFVPVPSGRIPVELSGKSGNLTNYNVSNKTVNINVPAGMDLSNRQTRRHLIEQFGR